MKFAIGIPTLNRYDLLKPCLMLYERDFPNIDIFVIDNGKQGISCGKVMVTDMDQNIGVAASWNILCDKIYSTGADHALILNDDIYLGKKFSRNPRFD